MLDLFELFFLLIVIFDGVIIGNIIKLISIHLFGDTPSARLIRLILSVCGGIGYVYWCFNLLFGETDMSDGLALFIVFAPVTLLIILKIIDYMYSGSDENKE